MISEPQSYPTDLRQIQPSPACSGQDVDSWDPEISSRKGPLQRWLEGEQEPADSALVPSDIAGQDGELEQMRSRLALTKARTALLRDPGWLEEPTAEEQDADRHAAAQIRALRREHTLAAAIAHTKLGATARRVDNRLARLELSDKLWSRKALARRNRLLNPASRLASLHRAHVASSAALIGVATAGIAWTSAGVHDAIVGPEGSVLAYLVEPIFCIPLLVIMLVSAQATAWNHTFPPPAQRRRVLALEAFLLTSTIAMNTVSVLPGVGTWHDTATLLAHLVPPMLIVVAVVLQPLIAGFLAGILTRSAVEAEPTPVPPRLAADTTTTLQLVARVMTAINQGDLTEWAETGLPSISAIQRHLRCEKRRAQLVWDALRLLGEGSPISGSASGSPTGATPAAMQLDRTGVSGG